VRFSLFNFVSLQLKLSGLPPRVRFIPEVGFLPPLNTCSSIKLRTGEYFCGFIGDGIVLRMHDSVPFGDVSKMRNLGIGKDRRLVGEGELRLRLSFQ